MARLRRTTSRVIAATVTLIVCFAYAAPSYGAIWFADFSSTAGLTLNGGAASLNNGIDANPVLRLASAAVDNGGSAFTDSTMDITSFSATFFFRISEAGGITDVTGQTGADGLTFTIQPNAPTALGALGGDLGYGGITPSVAIEVDTWNNDPISFPSISDPDSNHIGIDVNGSLNSTITAAVPGQFDDGTLRSVWITYDGTTLTASSGGSTVSQVIDIPTSIGTGSAYVGLTAATGGAFGDHDIVSWHFGELADHDIPEPSTFAIWSLLGVTIMVACWRRQT